MAWHRHGSSSLQLLARLCPYLLSSPVRTAGTSQLQSCFAASQLVTEPMLPQGFGTAGASAYADYRQDTPGKQQLVSSMHWHQQRRQRSDAVQQADAGQLSGRDVFVYEAPLSATVRRLKKLSLFSCAVTFAAAPVIVSLNAAAGTPLGAKLSIAALLCGFGCFTTGLLHWFTSPYVHRLVYDRQTGLVEAKTLSLLARPVSSTFRPHEAAPIETVRPLTTFGVRGKAFYLDADNFADKALLAQLTPREPQLEQHG